MDIIDKVILGDAKKVLFDFPEKCVDTCITSPPYWGLRDYQTSTWVGGNENCAHRTSRDRRGEYGGKQETNVGSVVGSRDIKVNGACPMCGAIRKDLQIGLEQSLNEYVSSLVKVFEGVRHTLKDDGTVWLNIGDSYAGSTGQSGGEGISTKNDMHIKHGSDKALRPASVDGLKAKNLIGVPWHVALALQKAGWYLRCDIIWDKPNPMPDPVLDRPTRSHEYLFLFSKNKKYYYDVDSIREPYVEDINRWGGENLNASGKSIWDEGTGQNTYRDRKLRPNPLGRNKRSVWRVNTKPTPEAHFATFPPDLIIPCIKAGSPKGGLVMDPFMGSGTVAVVAKRLGRHYTGVELNPNYHKIINKRTRQRELFI